MSSNEEEYNDGDTSQGLEKKRRIQRACDMCRRKKSTCAQFSSTPMVLICIQSDVSEQCLGVEAAVIEFIGNGMQIPGNPCSNCISSRFGCTYVEAAKVRFMRVAEVTTLNILQKRSPPKG